MQYVKLLGFTQRDVFVRAFPPDGSIRLPLPRLVGALLKPLLERQVRKEVTAAADEDKHEIEVRTYPRSRVLARAGGGGNIAG